MKFLGYVNYRHMYFQVCSRIQVHERVSRNGNILILVVVGGGGGSGGGGGKGNKKSKNRNSLCVYI